MLCIFKTCFISFSDDPKLKLSLGSQLVPDQISEGHDVYFECWISANPPVHEVLWYHNVSI